MSLRLLAVPGAIGTLALVTALVAGCSRRPETLADVAARLPTAVGDLRAVDDDERYSPSEIFAYLDGGAEVYLAYNLVGCHVRRYTGGLGEVTVDLFEMGSSADAFGVFSHDLEGDPVAVGQRGRVRAGWLSAWKGRFLISVTADRDDQSARDGVVAVGTAIAACIRREGSMPELTAVLPEDGLAVERVGYAHDHVALASQVTLPGGNPLGLTRETEVAIGRYRRGAAVATLVLARFPTEDAAASGCSALAEAWATAPGVTVRDDRGMFRAVAAGGTHVAAAADANDEGTAHVLLAEALSRAAAGGR